MEYQGKIVSLFQIKFELPVFKLLIMFITYELSVILSLISHLLYQI